MAPWLLRASLQLASSYSRVAVSSVFWAQNKFFSAQTRGVPLRGFAQKGYTPLFLRQKGAYLENAWTIYNKHCMISYCFPFWRKNTGEYPPCVYSAQQTSLFGRRNYPFSANARDSFRKSSTSRQHDSKALLRFSHEGLIKVLVWVRQAERTFRQSPPQGDSRDRG